MTTRAARPTERARDAWDRLLGERDIDDSTLEWLVKQATGWPDCQFAKRAVLCRTLPASPLPIRCDHPVLRTTRPGVGSRQVIVRRTPRQLR